MGQQFKIKTDHETIKHFLHQRITTPMQQKWLSKSKLVGYNYVIEDRAGKLNTAHDVLSRRHELLSIMGISTPVLDCINNIKQTYIGHPTTADIITKLQSGQQAAKHFTLNGDLLNYKQRIYVSPSHIRAQLLESFHSTLEGGNSRVL